jgi:uncharacterized membrane protein YhaH (DUF805 family)
MLAEAEAAVINFLFNPNGRVSRKQIWFNYLLPVAFAGFVANFVDAAVFGASLTSRAAFADGAPPMTFGLSFFLNLFLLWPSIAVPVKRFHDRGMTGWWVLLFALGIVFCGGFAVFEMLANAPSGSMGAAGPALLVLAGLMLAQFVILYCLPGQDGENRFGPDPRDPAGATADVFGAPSGGPSGGGWADSVDFKAAREAAPAAPAAPARALYGQRRTSPAAPGGPVTFGRRVR